MARRSLRGLQLLSSAQTADARKHRVNLDRLHALGAVSAYPGHSGLGHGEEDAMTLRWVGREGISLGFHCDFVFSSAALARRVTAVEVGTFDDWSTPDFRITAP